MTTRPRLILFTLVVLFLGVTIGRATSHTDDPHCAPFGSYPGHACVEFNPDQPTGSELIIYPEGTP